MTYSNAFEEAVNHAMKYEVGGFWKLTPTVQAGLIRTAAERRAVGYVNDPLDAGGETKFGVARNANPDINVRSLDWEGAKAIYYRRYWLAGSCDKLDGRVAVLHFDGCVNHGIARANVFLQRAVGVQADGMIGPITVAKTNSLNAFEVCKKICDQREQFYRQIVASNPSQIRFLNGWLRRINEMRQFTLNPNNEF